LSSGKTYTGLKAVSRKGNFNKATMKMITQDLAAPLSEMTDAITLLKSNMR